MEKELINKLKYLINKKRSLSQICEELELKDYEVIGLVELLKEDGFLADYIDGEIVKLKKPPKQDDVYQVPAYSENIKLCLISDTHLCSKYDRLDILNYIYEKAYKNNVKHILHSGDFTDGRSHRPEHIYELKELSYDGQVDYCVEKYPKQYGIYTYAISGNHDNWWYKSNGSEIVKSIAKQRDDIIYLGSDYADLKLGKIKIRLFHGKGNAYAKSYPLQKYMDSIPADERPQILQTGHIHQSFYMKQDNTHCFQTSCLEDLTPYAKSQGFAGDKSCWWLDIESDNKGRIFNIDMELESFEGKKRVRR
jgi:predicted phosphodiesterase